jgi:hypothetical protein
VKPRSESQFPFQIDYRPKAGLKAIWKGNRLPPLICFMIPFTYNESGDFICRIIT